ncbi:MAG: ribose 5-phosphate isomerase B [Bacillota bacterium]|nr:ribose 5-phosphate isomerase B [Bacillota bacterium]
MNTPALRRILLLCTGNTCRSPMAAGLLRAALRDRFGERADKVEVRTAGVSVACPGEGASSHAVQVLSERGISLAGHRARQLTPADLGWAELVLTMTRAQKAAVLRLDPLAADRAFVLREFTAPAPAAAGPDQAACYADADADVDVADPIGRGLDAYRAAARDLEKELARLVELIAGEEGSVLPAITAVGAEARARPEHTAGITQQGPAPALSLAVGADHAGYQMKHELTGIAVAMGYEVVDFGASGPASVDYPDFAAKVAATVATGRCRFGLLVCGTGIGMAIAANKIRGIRAATCNDLFLARMARKHNNANVLCIGARVIGAGLAGEVLRTFLSTPFGGERHERRVRKICDLELPPGKEPC